MPSNINIEIEIQNKAKKVIEIKSKSIEGAMKNTLKKIKSNEKDFNVLLYSNLNSYLRKTKKKIKVDNSLKSKKNIIELKFFTTSPIYTWLTEGVRHSSPIQPKWRRGNPFLDSGRPKAFKGSFIHEGGKAFALSISGKENFFTMYIHPYIVPKSKRFEIVVDKSKDNLIEKIEEVIKK